MLFIHSFGFFTEGSKAAENKSEDTTNDDSEEDGNEDLKTNDNDGGGEDDGDEDGDDKEDHSDEAGQAQATNASNEERSLRIYNTITSTILPQLHKCVTKKVCL